MSDASLEKVNKVRDLDFIGGPTVASRKLYALNS